MVGHEKRIVLEPYFCPCLKEPARRLARYRRASDSRAAIALNESLEAALVARKQNAVRL
jgi:hypothetical protein